MTTAALALLISVLSLFVAAGSLVLQYVRHRHESPGLIVRCALEDTSDGRQGISVIVCNERRAPQTVTELGFYSGQRRFNLLDERESALLQPGEMKLAGDYVMFLDERFPRDFDGNADGVYAATGAGRIFHGPVPEDVKATLQEEFGAAYRPSR